MDCKEQGSRNAGRFCQAPVSMQVGHPRCGESVRWIPRAGIALLGALLVGVQSTFGGNEDVIDHLAQPHDCFRRGRGLPGAGECFRGPAAVDFLVLTPGSGQFPSCGIFGCQQCSSRSIRVFAQVRGAHGIGHQTEDTL
jgi:hypothetical protein